MEDIEDMVTERHAGLRLPLQSVVPQPRTSSVTKENLSREGVPGVQKIYVKTFGCSHNQSDSEYMAGQLSAYGYTILEEPDSADLWLINTCTVKSPSQSAMETLIRRGKKAMKPLVIAGCVPQGSKNLKELEGVSIVGVQQIDRVVEVVEETLKGFEVRLLRRSSLPSLDLPKVRKNKFVEILPINVGCLGACTYCKTKHARGHLGSYPVTTLVDRLKSVIADGVKEVWLSSEDTGAYGRDIRTDLPTLLHALVAELPKDGSVMLRIGMTNPPYILEHLEEIAKILCHPAVYAFLHVPVQSGSDSVLNAMKREYSVAEFRRVVDTLLKLVPGIQIATDVICGFPGETEDDFEKTIKLIKEYRFSQVHISQFYPRPGTPAARMKRVPTGEVKRRSRELTSIFEAFSPYSNMEGRVVKVLVTDVATDSIHLVGHTKSYIQVLLPADEDLRGRSVNVRVRSAGRWSVMGDIIPFERRREDEALSRQVEGAEKTGQEDEQSCQFALQHNVQKLIDSCANKPVSLENGQCGENCCNHDVLNRSSDKNIPSAVFASKAGEISHTNGLVQRRPLSVSQAIHPTDRKEPNPDVKFEPMCSSPRKFQVLDWLLIAFILVDLTLILFVILNKLHVL